jgi:hypothetical protein
MALTFSVLNTWDDGKRIHVSGTAGATGSSTTSGDTLDLSQEPIIASAQPPIQDTAWMEGLARYDYVCYPGGAMNANKVKIFSRALQRARFRSSRRELILQRLPETRSLSRGSRRSCSSRTHRGCQKELKIKCKNPAGSARARALVLCRARPSWNASQNRCLLVQFHSEAFHTFTK